MHVPRRHYNNTLSVLMPQRSHSHRVQQTLNKPREHIVHAAGRAVRVCCLASPWAAPPTTAPSKPGRLDNPKTHIRRRSPAPFAKVGGGQRHDVDTDPIVGHAPLPLAR